MKRANKLGARVALVLGDDELARDAVSLRDLDTGEQVEVPRAELGTRLAVLISKTPLISQTS